MEKEEFKKLCSDLGLNIYEYPVCAYCGEVIYGSFLWGKKGNMCDECSVKGLK
jgi:hypothetical protein